LAKGNKVQHNTLRTQGREKSASNGLDRVREVARKDKKVRFTALLHHVNVARLREAYFSLKRNAATGVDQVTWQGYGERLEENLADLHDRVHRGAYRAKPSRRVYIPKADGRQRPLGVAALEDKVLQRAVVEVLNAIYEADFHGFSYGFRPGRSQHNALDALSVAIEKRKVSWVLDADIRGFFDNLNHECLKELVERRIADQRILRLIEKWLAAGVIEDGKWGPSSGGTPQGATISPLLANIYLHYALDGWAHEWRKTRARGEIIIVRYADDFVVGFQYRSDAERFHVELQERLACFKLALHPEKTRLIEFGRFAAKNREQRQEGKPETFNFLGFTHICSTTKRGNFCVLRQTMSKRMTAKLKAIGQELMRRRHTPIPEQGKWLGAVVRGFFNYHAVPRNTEAMKGFHIAIFRLWHRAMTKRSQNDRTKAEQAARHFKKYIPKVRVLHPYPSERLVVTTQGKSRMR
jgi:group II intron reverse transcriptase/maturase